MMTMEEILELQRMHHEQVLEQRLKQAKYETRQELLRLGIIVITEQIRSNTFALFYGALRDS